MCAVRFCGELFGNWYQNRAHEITANDHQIQQYYQQFPRILTRHKIPLQVEQNEPSRMSLIERIHPTTDDAPPWAGMSFTHPVDSDELHEQLKTAYPECSTFRERKHRATIKFLEDEFQQMQSKSSNSMPLSDLSHYAGLSSSPEEGSPSERAYKTRNSWQRAKTSHATASSDCSSSTWETSPKHEESQDSPRDPSSSNQSAEAAQHDVFSATEGTVTRLKRKRKLMTMEEKRHYRAVRGRGACSRCRTMKCKVCRLSDG